MALGCGEGRETIYEGYSLIYLLGTHEDGLIFPDEKKDIVPPNSAVCDKHLRNVPERAYSASHEGIEGKVFAVARGTGGYNPYAYGGSASLLGASSDTLNLKYLTEADMTRYLPGALEIIALEIINRCR